MPALLRYVPDGSAMVLWRTIEHSSQVLISKLEVGMMDGTFG